MPLKSLSEDTFLISVSLHKSLRFSFPHTHTHTYIYIYIFIFLVLVLSSALFSPLNPLSFLRTFLGMGRFKSLVDSEEGIESFRSQYKILPGVRIRYCKEG